MGGPPAARHAVVAGVQAVLLIPFVALAYAQWRMFGGTVVASDYTIYLTAVAKAWQHADPYLPHNIGLGYLYPPPSLLLLRASELLATPHLSAATLWVAWEAVAVCASLALLMGRPSWTRVSACLLLLSTAGVVETIQIGQINALVLFFLVAFFCAWQRQRHWLACAALAIAICLKGTPVIFAALLLTRDGWRWALLLVGLVAALFVVGQLLIPADHLTSSYLDAVWWASAPARIRNPFSALFNYSLSVSIPALVLHLGPRAAPLAWSLVHWGKLAVLALLLGGAYLAYLRSGGTAKARDLLFVTCTVCMVLAPNIVWLHHAILLVPAFWVLMAESDRPLVWALALLALCTFQMTRVSSHASPLGPALVFGVAQLLLLLAVLAYAWTGTPRAERLAA
jgi:Glycosyltransferase family 87